MSLKPVIVAPAVVVVAIVLAGAFRAARSTEPPVVTDAACLECHQSDAAAMAGTAHDAAVHKVVSCLSCHNVDAAHLENPEENHPVDFEHVSADSLTAACVSCHAHPHALNVMERDPHGEVGLSCNACHRVHENRHAGLLIDEQKNLCLSCHPSARADFAKASRHPVEDGVVECQDCHVNVARSGKQHTGSGPGETCVDCHAMFRGPFPFEHQAAVEYSTEEGGCLNCHEAHGSAFPRLLKQSYEAPNYSLCSQCHSVPGHLNNINHGTQWAGVPCDECHSDIHGSYSSRNLLDTSLQSQGCFAVGCHQM